MIFFGSTKKKSLLCRSDLKCEMVHTTFISFVVGKEVRTKRVIEIVMTNELLYKVSKNHKWDSIPYITIVSTVLRLQNCQCTFYVFWNGQYSHNFVSFFVTICKFVSLFVILCLVLLVSKFVFNRLLVLHNCVYKRRRFLHWDASFGTRFAVADIFFATAKGLLISKENLLVLIWTKKRTKLFFDFCPSL